MAVHNPAVIAPPTPAAVPDVLRILSDGSVVKYNPAGRVEDLSEVEALLGRWLEHWSQLDFGNCSVFEKETEPFIGDCGVRRMAVHTTPVLNLMYRFDPRTWGRGYATEAALAVLNWASREPLRPNRARQDSSQERGQPGSSTADRAATRSPL